MSSVTEDVIIKRLEDGVHLGPGLLKKQHTEMFSVANFVLSKKTFSHEIVKACVRYFLLNFHFFTK